MTSFVFEASPGRVVFGAGALDHLPREIEQLGARRALALSTSQPAQLANNLSVRLGDRSVGVHPHAVMHVPVEVARTGIEEVGRLGADCVVAAGGGSTIGLAKANALQSALPILAVPTTYAGSCGLLLSGMLCGHDRCRVHWAFRCPRSSCANSGAAIA